MGLWENEARTEKQMKLEADGDEGDSKNGVESQAGGMHRTAGRSCQLLWPLG